MVKVIEQDLDRERVQSLLFGLGFDYDDGDDGGGELVMMMVTLGDDGELVMMMTLGEDPVRGKQLTAYFDLDQKGLVSPY